jgi:predicted nucleic acid-binding protein
VKAGEHLIASVLTKVEILVGMRAGEERATRRLLGSVDLVEVDDEVSERAGLLASRSLRSHPGVATVDYVIDVTAQRSASSSPASNVRGELWTRNLKHSRCFPACRHRTDLGKRLPPRRG